MKDTGDVTACVVDHGMYFGCAERLARDMKKVYYHRPFTQAFPTFAEGVVGDGHSGVELLPDFWPKLGEIDLFVFPDIGDSGLQLHLLEMEKAVWGSKTADRYERNRGLWLRTAAELELPMPPTHVLKGLRKLREFLSDRPGEKFFIKISTWRGDMETWSAKEPAHVRNKLDLLAMKFGPMQDEIYFYVQEELKTDIEGGADTYFAGGDYPDKIVLGYEKKGEGYFATWFERERMPKEIWTVTQKVGTILARSNYANLVSSEVRVAEGDSFLLDPCFRFPSPAGEAEVELYENFADIVWQGGNGILVQPEMLGKFAGEAIIEYSGDRDTWKSIEVPEEVRRWVKLYGCACHRRAYHFNPQQDPAVIGCAIAIADEPQGVIDKLKEIQDAMKDAYVTFHLHALADLVVEIDKAEQEGIPFTQKEMPEPGAVLEDN